MGSCICNQNTLTDEHINSVMKALEAIPDFQYILVFAVGSRDKYIKPKRKDFEHKQDHHDPKEWSVGIDEFRYNGMVFNKCWQILELNRYKVNAYRPPQQFCADYNQYMYLAIGGTPELSDDNDDDDDDITRYNINSRAVISNSPIICLVPNKPLDILSFSEDIPFGTCPFDPDAEFMDVILLPELPTIN
eukprot:141546_1